MLITRLELENIKSYRRLAVEFRRGTTAIQGANGAGKTTLVEAIGFALFDALPYKHSQFVREGEKYGLIRVHLLGNDERRYVVERRCGASAYWQLYDCEADYHLEQRTDVLDKLHELFGIERERPLPTLFQDALGVPQGTFTAIFLEAPAKRKKTFDELLQIEDYRLASDYLREVQNCYKEQMQQQQQEIQRLNFETRDLGQWRQEREQARQEEQHQTELITNGTRRLEELENHYALLQRQRDELLNLRHRFEQAQLRREAAHQRLHQCERELVLARQAHAQVEANRAAYLAYQEAEAALQELRQAERQRNTLRQQQAALQRRQAGLSANKAHVEAALKEIERARQRVIELSPLADRQRELERRREELRQQVQRYDELVEEGRSLRRQQEQQLKRLQELQHQVREIEPLLELAGQLPERIALLTRLQARLSERSQKQLQLQEKLEILHQKEEERTRTAERLRNLEETIAAVEAHRQEVETLPTLREEQAQLTARRYRLEGNIDGYRESYSRSRGGLCPLLHEPCLNIRQKGLASLESYFEQLIASDEAQLADLRQQQQELEEQIARLSVYAQEYERLGHYRTQQSECAERLRQLAGELLRLQRDVDDLRQDLDELQNLAQEIAQAEQARRACELADQRVRALPALRAKVEQLEEQLKQLDEQLVERRQQVQQLQGVRERLKEVELQLRELDDPAGQIRGLLTTIEREPGLREQLSELLQQEAGLERELQELAEHLGAYQDLDGRLAEQESRRQQAQAGYQTYLAHEQGARQLPQRQQAYERATVDYQGAEQELQQAERSYRQAQIAFDEAAFQRTDEEIKKLRADLKGYTTALQHTRSRIAELEARIRQAEALLVALEAAQQEYRTLEDLSGMTDLFRQLLKEAAPQILRARLAEISAEANRIFGEIMGDRSAQLSWQDDYEIVVRSRSATRTFAQLSGGEQMSAALAVRLALLKKLSNLTIAFFDEPTQNMDSTRRTNLAEQIRRVRGFDQLIVISHDDTFEQGLDSLIRLRKENGETLVVSEEEWQAAFEREEEHAHAP
ncbi:AAA family ATPase [Thermogemmatispora onikobensis]|uniref:AAA family ATPase n=1 Tax=Thermogemmatispora onikobensis TaxID=732234 RepID=UPI00085320BD|nr:SMC family ATPase [Thermogemmatispora onikobensis]